MAGAAGEWLGNVGELDAGTMSAIYLATFIGGVTFTGSVVAFSKLAGLMKSAALSLPGRDQINLSMVAVVAAGMAAFLNPEFVGSLSPDVDPVTLQLASLSLNAAVSSILGYHLVASIGGADMPVVITVLNRLVFISFIFQLLLGLDLMHSFSINQLLWVGVVR